MKKVILTAALLGAILSLTVAFKNTEGEKNVTIINAVEVKDFAKFKKGFDAGASVREKAGIKVINLYQSVENPNAVTVIEEANDVASAKAFFNDPKAKEAMQKAGVISKPEIRFLNKVN
jgi:quinol monooxygenase YgiN